MNANRHLRNFGLGLLLAALASPAIALEQEDRSQKASAFVDRIDDVAAFLEEVDATLVNARDGHYGSITRENFDQLIISRNTIVRLLKGQDQARDLEPEARIEVYNAQETMQAVLRNRPDDRVECKRIVVHGSRMTKYECLSVAQREARTRAARETTEELQRVDCIPSARNRCG